jgi:uroporphyrinogen III methyltransferase/synthase
MNRLSPISGKTILVTRSADQFEDFARTFRERGAHLISHPVIELAPPASWTEVDRAIAELQEQQFDWLIFTSSNGVRYFFERLEQLNQTPDFSRIKLAAVGPQTAKVLQGKGLSVDLIPEIFDGLRLARELTNRGSKQTSPRPLALRAEQADPALAEAFQRSGVLLRDVVVYRSFDRKEPDPSVCQLLQQSQIDWVTLTSPAIARNTVRLFGPLLNHSKLASLSPKISQLLMGYGLTPAAEAKTFDRFGLMTAMEEFHS